MKAEELIVQFKIDDSELKKGYEDIERSNDKVEKSLKDIEHKAEKTADSIMGFARKVGGFFVALFATSEGIGAAIDNAREVARLGDLSKSLNSSIEDIDALNKAVTSMGGNQSDSESSLTSLFSNISEAANNTSSDIALTFKKMGVSVKDSSGKMKSLVDVMGDLSEVVQGMDEKKAEAFLKSLGVTDQTTLNLMLKGREELERTIRAQKELGVHNAESEAKARELNEAMGRLSNTFSRIKAGLSSGVSPALTTLVDGFDKLLKWMKENKAFVIGFFGSITAVILGAYIPTILSAAAATWALIAPFLAIALPVIAFGAALALVVDDIWNFIQGNDSLLGRLLEAYPQIKAFVDDTLAVIYDVIDGIKEWFAIAKEEVSIFINDLIETMTGKIKDWQDSFSTIIGDTIDSVIGFFKNMWKEFETIYNKIMAGINTITGAKKKVVDKTNTAILDTFMEDYDGTVTMTEDRKKELGWKDDGAGNLIPPYQQKSHPSFLNPQSLAPISNAAQQATEGAKIMPQVQSIINENKSNVSSLNSNKTVKIDSIEIKMPAGDPVTMTKHLEEAITKVLNDQFDDVIVQSSTGLV